MRIPNSRITWAIASSKDGDLRDGGSGEAGDGENELGAPARYFGSSIPPVPPSRPISRLPCFPIPQRLLIKKLYEWIKINGSSCSSC